MKIKTKSIAAAIGLFALMGVTSAHAGTSLSSFATIDLNAANFLNFSGDAEFVPSFGTEFTDANAEANGFHFANDPISAVLNINEDGGSVNTSATFDPLDISSISNVTDRGFGGSTMEYILDYIILGTGQIEVTVPYQLTIDATTAPITDLSSNAFGMVTIDDASLTSGDSQFLNWFQGDGNGPIDNIGLLTFLMDVNDGDAGSLRFFAQTGTDLFTPPAAVPLPPSGLLMLGSLFGLAFRVRRRNIASAGDSLDVVN